MDTDSPPASADARPLRHPWAGPRTLMVLVVGALVALVLMVQPSSTPVPFLGWYVLSSLLPATFLVVFRPAKGSLIAVGVLVVVSAGWVTHQRFSGSDPFQLRHDGGVVATGAAARLVLDGENPYTADFEPALRPHHHLLAADSDNPIVNPLVDHYPYLPAAFLVQAPVEGVADLVGHDGDARWLYAVAVAGLVGLVAGATRPGWARAAALMALAGNLAVASYLSWGANDSAAAALVVLAAYGVRRRPALAGAAVAIAISIKLLLVVAVVPIAFLARRHGGARARRDAALAGVAILAATVVPYLVWSPRDLWEDTVAFNLGLTELTYPTSGIGFGAAFPGVFTGPVSAVASVVLVALVAWSSVGALRRSPTPAMASFVSGCLVVAGLLPARTFQMSYFPLPVILWSVLWLDAPQWSLAPVRGHGARSARGSVVEPTGGGRSATLEEGERHQGQHLDR